MLAPFDAFNAIVKHKSTSTNHSASTLSHSRVILQTAIVQLKCHDGLELKARALIDRGSELSYIKTCVAEQLGMSKLKERDF
jgi:hypothetical protein